MIIGSSRRIGKEPVVEVSEGYPEGLSSQFYATKASVPYTFTCYLKHVLTLFGYRKVLNNTFVKPLEPFFIFILWFF